MVFHCHNRLLQRSAVALTGQALELASAHVIACCQHAAEPFREYVEQQRLRVIYNGVPDMSADQRREQKIRTIGVIGRVELGKGQLEFVRAARIVLQAFPHCRFQVVGAPMFSSPKYYSKVAACSRAMPVEFLDWAEDMAKIYSELDLLVVPSSEVEATTRVILEAFSARVPVVAFPVGGIPEVLKDGETGFLTSALSVKALAARIISVLQMDQSKLAEVVEAARGEWQRRFTLAAYRARVCDLLASAMEPQSLGYGAVSEAAPVLTD
jgi:glycosyltransferase involved in cell wall biosynthesis